MTRQEYEKKIEEIISGIEEKGNEIVQGELEQLSSYNPRRLLWYYAQAKNQYERTGDGSIANAVLRGKCAYLFTYTGLNKCLQLQRELARSRKNFFDVKRYNYLLRSLGGDFSYYNDANDICRIALAETDQDRDFDAYRELYGCRDYIGYLIRQRARRKRFPKSAPVREFQWVNNIGNMGYLLQEIGEETDRPIVVMESGHNSAILELLCADLQLLGKHVFFMKKPLVYESDGVSIEDTVAISVESLEHSSGVSRLVPVMLVKSDGSHEDNRGYLLHYINRTYNEGKVISVLADGDTTDELCTNKKFCKRISQIAGANGAIDRKNLALSRYGDYVSYISRIYGTDCHPMVTAAPTIRFSIVIPARNSSDTLRYTLQTCLEQRFTGDYEIVVSDNSTGHNAAVYELCRELNDPRIVYLKTPRDLPLAKSFEYAYLHAKGEYIFALGSDDGLLPWALEVLDGVAETYPEEEIIQWTRGFYAWPGFNGGQEHQFVIPKKYKNDELGLGYREALDYIGWILRDPGNMYGLPMLYINSCFKRSYFQTLLDKTGRLWDGICQDIYMGVITACIHPRILNIDYTLTIAGMSPRSVGAHANLGQKTNEEFEMMMKEVRADNNMGGYFPSYLERLVPDTGSDVCSMYKCLLRAIGIGVLPEQYLTEVFDWKKIFADIASLMDVRDVVFDRKIHEMRCAAMLHGDEFLAWFDNAIYEPALEPRIIDEEHARILQKQRTYRCGTNANGGVTLDASEYGVTNIYEAVKLFEKLTGL